MEPYPFQQKVVFMKNLLKLFTWLVVLWALAGPAAGAEEVVSLFNGKDLSGWKAPEPNAHWKVEDGILIGENDPKLKGSILWTEKIFTDFELALEFRFTGTVDSGVFLRTTKQQVQIGRSGSLKRDMTGSMYVPGKGYPGGDAKGVTEQLTPGTWHRMKIRAVGPAYTLWFNGEEVFRFTGEKAPKEGAIGLQIHPNLAMRIDFRKLTLLELPASP